MERTVIATPNAPAAIGPYSQAVKAGNLIFVSGQIPLDPKTGAMIQGGVREQTKQVMENARAILDASGSGFEKVVKATIYLVSLNDFSIVNEEYGAFFPSDPPARATVQVAGLPRGAAVEIDFIALN